MACPMGYGVRFHGGKDVDELCDGEKSGEPSRSNDTSNPNVSYHDYLQLDKVLTAQSLRSEVVGHDMVHDEHLFIVTHQTYELWFKQILFDVDHVRSLLNQTIVDETKTLKIVSLLERTVRILKLLVDQILILETMSPLDFVEFRRYLTSASGFQSLQFRLLENKLGILNKNRVHYNMKNYKEAFSNRAEHSDEVEESEKDPSLFVLIERWLARTPGIDDDIDEDEEEAEEKEEKENTTDEKHVRSRADQSSGSSATSVRGKNSFWARYMAAVKRYLDDMQEEIYSNKMPADEIETAKAEFAKTKRSFETITDEKIYEIYLDRLTGERRLNYNALKGALMIYFYRDMPRFSQPYQILTFLMDIDSLLQKWRYNHVMLVQRMLGSKQGTGGSSGYMYLRSTVADRYKIFLDLYNLSTWLIPRAYVPKLSKRMVKTLSEHKNLNVKESED